MICDCDLEGIQNVQREIIRINYSQKIEFCLKKQVNCKFGKYHCQNTVVVVTPRSQYKENIKPNCFQCLKKIQLTANVSKDTFHSLVQIRLNQAVDIHNLFDGLLCNTRLLYVKPLNKLFIIPLYVIFYYFGFQFFIIRNVTAKVPVRDSHRKLDPTVLYEFILCASGGKSRLRLDVCG